MTEKTTDLHFCGVPRPARLIDCADLLPRLSAIFPTWPYTASGAGDAPADPVITVRREGGAYFVSAPWLDGPLRSETEVELFGDLIVDVIHAWLEANPSALCLHTAAVEYAGRLVLFPNTNRAGKSLLAARLMAEGRRCFGDDLVALLPDGSGLAFGAPPRLRLPLPASEPDLAEFLRACGGPADARYSYLAAPSPALAQFGETRPLGAVVMLERRERGPAELVPADSGESLRNLVFQHYMRPGDAPAVLDASARLVRALPCWRLRYARLDDAADSLRRAFLEGERSGFAIPEAVQRPETDAACFRPKKSDKRRRRATTERFVRNPDALLREEEGETFLTQADGNCIFHLNPTGRAVWELLAEPCSEAEAAALLSAAFPAADPAQIERDTVALFVALKKNGLLQTAPASA